MKNIQNENSEHKFKYAMKNEIYNIPTVFSKSLPRQTFNPNVYLTFDRNSKRITKQVLIDTNQNKFKESKMSINLVELRKAKETKFSN